MDGMFNEGGLFGSLIDNGLLKIEFARVSVHSDSGWQSNQTTLQHEPFIAYMVVSTFDTKNATPPQVISTAAGWVTSSGGLVTNRYGQSINVTNRDGYGGHAWIIGKEFHVQTPPSSQTTTTTTPTTTASAICLYLS